MTEPLPPWLANVDPRYVRHDWKKWLRPDWQSWMPPGARFDAKPAPRSEFERLYQPYRDEPSPPPHRRGASGLTEADILFFRSNLAALRFKLALLKLKLKALHPSNYKPEQPRVPKGNPDGGQWTRVAGPPGIGHNQGPPFDDFPEIPKEKPETAQERNAGARSVAEWLASKFPQTGVGIFIGAMQIAPWLVSEAPNIVSFQDSPKTIDELQQDVWASKKGYHRHHIAEQTSAEEDGFSREMIDAPDNMVRVPTYKHIDITTWYATRNPEFGGKSPREYLRGRSWAERRELELYALRKYGVLKP